MKLFYMPGACSLAPHIVLEWIGVPFELGRVERGKTREPGFLVVNPAGKVPALIEEDGRVLTEAEVTFTRLDDKVVYIPATTMFQIHGDRVQDFRL